MRATQARRRAWTALAAAFYVTMLTWSAIPGQEAQLFGQTSDKLLHFGAYAVLAQALYLGDPGTHRLKALRTLALVAALGALDETIQRLQPHRTPDLADWVVDVLAAAVVATGNGLRMGWAARRANGRRARHDGA